MFDHLVATTAGTHGAGAVDAWTRVEAAACARRLAAMVAMLDDAHAATGSADRDQWCLDNWAAVCAHIGAAGRITSGAASGLLLVGTALRDRLPKSAAVFADGLIGYPVVRTIVSRSALVTDPDAVAALDSTLAAALRSWEPMSVDKTEQTIDTFIAQVDPHALRRTHTAARSRSVGIAIEDGSGLATVFGTLFTPNATALDTRLNALADTVCPADPRTKDQRRSDALGALAHGADRLSCLCGTEDCPAADIPPPSGVVVYVIAHHDTLDGIDVRPVPEPDGPSTPDVPDVPGGASVADDRAEGFGDSGSRSADNASDYRADCVTAESAGLDSTAPIFAKPLRDLTLTEARTPASGSLSNIGPAAMMGEQFLPGPVARHVALDATVTTISHPGRAGPPGRR